MATTENLNAAFAGESQANRKYLAFAKRADADGRPQIARLFRAAAAAETVHAHAHLRAMGGVKDTAANLEAAVEGENHEATSMYPKFLAEAEAEKNQPAVVSFRNALAVEKVHRALYTQALDTHKAGKDLAAKPIFVCDVCGNTVLGAAPDTCPICGAAKSRFFEVE